MNQNKTLEAYQLISPVLLGKLEKLSIKTRQDLINEGSLKIFLKIQSVHPGLTKSFLWRLYAIERDINIDQISPEIKNKLSQALKKIGLVREFPASSEMERHMKLAILEAQKAYILDEVPIGAVIVFSGKIVGTGYNRCISDHNIGHHAEMLAIKEASQNLQNYRLNNCDLYVTVEPCMMCTGAIIQARISRVIYGVKEKKTGMVDSFCSENYAYMNHHTAFRGGVLKQECMDLLTVFFLSKRKSPTK